MQRENKIAVLTLASGQLSQGRPVLQSMGMPTPMVCDDLWIGTLQDLSDVVQDEAVQAAYLVAGE